MSKGAGQEKYDEIPLKKAIINDEHVVHCGDEYLVTLVEGAFH